MVPTKAVMADRIEAEAAVDSVVGVEALTEAAEEAVVEEAAAWGRCLTMGSVCVWAELGCMLVTAWDKSVQDVTTNKTSCFQCLTTDS